MKTAVKQLLPFVSDKNEDQEWEEVLATARKLLEAERMERLYEFTKKNLFGEGGVFREIPKEEQVRLLASVLDVLEGETRECIERDRPWSCSDGIGWEDANLEPRLGHLTEAAENGVFLPDWRDRIASIEEATHHYHATYSGQAIRCKREKIQEAAGKIEQLLGETPDGLTGTDLEFAPSVGGGQKLYLDGKYVTAVTDNAQFSETPTDGHVVTWLVVEQIDYCNSRGPQMSWKVFAWTKELGEVKRIFEDHAYASERPLSVEAPVVTEDGKIRVVVIADGEKKEREVMPDGKPV